MATISRQEYNNLFGPTVGDKIRLGDTDLYVEIEKDLREYGDEVVYGGGKTLRDGMGLANTMTSEEGSLDLVITNVTVIDAKLGVVKADAYGHGAVPVARKLEELGAEYLAVACLAEARELREAGVLTPILLLGYTPTDCAEELLRYGLTQTVYDLESARAFSAAAQAAGRRLCALSTA